MLINTCRYSLTFDNETWKDKIGKKTHSGYRNKFKKKHKISFKKTSNTKNIYKTENTILKEPNGTLITDKSEVDEIFRDMFEKSMF